MKAIIQRGALSLFSMLTYASAVAAETTTTITDSSAARSPRNTQLRDELLAMTVEDQAIRVKPVDKFTEQDRQRMRAVDAKHEERMKVIVSQYGWPGRSLVGDEAASDAWLIVQHCQVDFQEQCLPLLKSAVDSNEAAGKCYAYLLDRIRMFRGKSQIYGTQFMNDKLVPIEDLAHVDDRRKAVGLGPLSEYIALVCKMNGWPNLTPQEASVVAPPLNPESHLP